MRRPRSPVVMPDLIEEAHSAPHCAAAPGGRGDLVNGIHLPSMSGTKEVEPGSNQGGMVIGSGIVAHDHSPVECPARVVGGHLSLLRGCRQMRVASGAPKDGPEADKHKAKCADHCPGHTKRVGRALAVGQVKQFASCARAE